MKNTNLYSYQNGVIVPIAAMLHKAHRSVVPKPPVPPEPTPGWIDDNIMFVRGLFSPYGASSDDFYFDNSGNSQDGAVEISWYWSGINQIAIDFKCVKEYSDRTLGNMHFHFIQSSEEVPAGLYDVTATFSFAKKPRAIRRFLFDINHRYSARIQQQELTLEQNGVIQAISIVNNKADIGDLNNCLSIWMPGAFSIVLGVGETATILIDFSFKKVEE